ncbi:MAG: metallopeptidase family protein [Patescibacteria group bacterium]|nr:metallopeptidase family protein [Patescibacteria group bacterium]MDE1944378.1 metallopeptidase family protein [Patescibacteria group bacterium]MDE1944995.1 metallopeptidase family protein [Patescibacteria group bacterium]MDE2057475.1 metallopeptidase family protein [Patescibacteria group bacterium]
MDPRAFEEIARQELAHVPPRFARRIENVAILIEDTPAAEVLREEGLGAGEVLLGLYRGVPAAERGSFYSGVLPDTITLYREPLLEEAAALLAERRAGDFASAVRLAVRETIWHELGHHFGLSEAAVEAREVAGTNRFGEGGGATRSRRDRAGLRARVKRLFSVIMGA